MTLSRRQLLALAPAALAARIPERRAAVDRHNPLVRAIDPRSALSVGNGEFAFTADATGLQTFLPLWTQSQWGWHTTPFSGPGGTTPKLTFYETHGRKVGYLTRPEGQKELYDWLRENPHRLNLGRIAFDIPSADRISDIEQTLDLWTGILHSRFRYSGREVVVTTACDPSSDTLSVIATNGPPVALDFSFSAEGVTGRGALSGTEDRALPGSLHLTREIDADRYQVAIACQTPGEIKRTGPHRLVLTPRGDRLELVCRFARADKASRPLPTARRIVDASRDHWPRFWSSGAAIDFSKAVRTDPHARELERRVILSQYLTAIQCAGSLPPQETGLTCNSWYGKFHLEMHFWHAAHFAVWGRAPLLERSLGWYDTILPSAREKARSQGYTGARWPKMTAPDGRDSPSPIGPLLIWQQPHPITMAELCYRAHPDRATLERYRHLVSESAEFMASYAWFDAKNSRYVLGPPVIPAQENHPPDETWNPTFELEYWADALETAQQWRERLGMPREPKWEDVRLRLSALPVAGGVYLAHENCPQTYTERNRDHPSMLAALGVLPGRKVDRETMRRTLKKVFAEWKWADVWGWDFPMVAMTAASLGEKEMAIDALMMDSPKNTWLPNGHNWQRENLPVYLPGNGALLLAIAHMARLRAFPESWGVGWEGLA
jgi:hypothetical protein